MTPEALTHVRSYRPAVFLRLQRAGHGDLIVDNLDVVRVRSPFHAEPQALHDLDDVRWFLHELEEAGR